MKKKSQILKKTFILDEEKKDITKDGISIKLTAAEFEILSLFIKKRGFIVSRDDIF